MKESLRKLTKKQRIVIIVAIIVLAAVIAVSVSVPLALRGRDKAIAPAFARFDQKSDYAIVAEWNKVKGASVYTVQYCYGARTDKNIREATTNGTKYSVRRQKGVLSLRVKADLEDAVFCDWITIDVSALTLSVPAVTISSSMAVSWTEVYYDCFGARTPVSLYTVDVGINGVYPSLGAEYGDNRYDFLPVYVRRYIESSYEEGLVEWEDVTFSIRVRALAAPLFPSSPTDEEKYLADAYDDGGYGYADFTVTKEIYEDLIK